MFPVCQKKGKEIKIADLTKDEISAERLWERITKETNYKKYPSWPNYKGYQSGQSPHGRYHKLFINPRLRNSLPIKNKVAPAGSIVVKENYTADKELAFYTVMAKVKDYNPANKDWYWAKYDMDGKVKAAGNLKNCADCHVGSNNDCLITWPLDKQFK